MNLHIVVSSLFSKKLVGSNLNPSISFRTLLGTRLHFFVVTWIPQLINMRRLKSWWLMILKTGCVTCILKLSSYLGKTRSSFASHLVYYFWACFDFHGIERGGVLLPFSGDRIVVHQRKPLSSLHRWCSSACESMLTDHFHPPPPINSNSSNFPKNFLTSLILLGIERASLRMINLKLRLTLVWRLTIFTDLL